MQNNLEGIAFDEVRDSKGTTYAVFRNSLRPRYSKVLFDIIKGYFFLLLIAGSTIFLTYQFRPYWWIIVIISSILIGYIAAYLALFIHEAGHYNIHPDKKINDRLGIIFLCLPFGLSLRSYRKIHWQHHVHLGTPEDREVSYFNALSKMFLLETLTGIHLLRTILRKENTAALTKEQVQESRLMLLAGFVLHIIILAAAFLTGNWPFAIAWILGFGIFFPFFATIRQMLEHRDELAHHASNFYKQSHGKVSRLFVHTMISSSFGSAGFTRHMIHHWDPLISYTRLKDIEEFLIACEKTAPVIQSSRTTYTKVFKKLIAAP
ncbi:MAG TPA: fatty acid desaturase [Chitinophagaceae bacterium]|nr:fatty acid desaturase [Chitinophagaceae bacterium]